MSPFLTQFAQIGNVDGSTMAAIFIVIFLAIGIHEYCHAKFADLAGDPTPGIYGRVTLNLFKHFDLLGSVMIVMTALSGFGIGWGKPVPMNPSKMRNPRWDHFVAVAAGPVSNLIQAAIWAVLFRITASTVSGLTADSFLVTLMLMGVIINISLFCFNLIPLGPLDGMWILGTFLDERTRVSWYRWNLTAGQFVFLGLIIFDQVSRSGILSKVLGPPKDFLLRFLLGG